MKVRVELRRLRSKVEVMGVQTNSAVAAGQDRLREMLLEKTKINSSVSALPPVTEEVLVSRPAVWRSRSGSKLQVWSEFRWQSFWLWGGKHCAALFSVLAGSSLPLGCVYMQVRKLFVHFGNPWEFHWDLRSCRRNGKLLNSQIFLSRPAAARSMWTRRHVTCEDSGQQSQKWTDPVMKLTSSQITQLMLFTAAPRWFLSKCACLCCHTSTVSHFLINWTVTARKKSHMSADFVTSGMWCESRWIQVNSWSDLGYLCCFCFFLLFHCFWVSSAVFFSFVCFCIDSTYIVKCFLVPTAAAESPVQMWRWN